MRWYLCHEAASSTGGDHEEGCQYAPNQISGHGPLLLATHKWGDSSLLVRCEIRLLCHALGVTTLVAGRVRRPVAGSVTGSGLQPRAPATPFSAKWNPRSARPKTSTT